MGFKPTPVLDDDEEELFGSPQYGGEPDSFDLAGLPNSRSVEPNSEPFQLSKPISDAGPNDPNYEYGANTGGTEPPPRAKQSASEKLQEILARAPDVYAKKKPGVWNMIGAAGLGAAQGWINSNPKGRPVDVSGAIENILYPGQKQREQQYGVELSAAEKADKLESSGEMDKARVAELGARTEAEKKRGGYYDAESAKATKPTTPHANQQQLEPTWAKENLPGLLPDEKGEYWVDKSIAEKVLDPNKAAGLTIIPEGSTAVNHKGEVVYQAPAKPEKTLEAEQPLGDRVSQINDAMTARYQVLHPGQPLPQHYTLPPDAKQKDFDRTDKLIEGEEKAFGTNENRNQTIELRKQTLALASGQNTPPIKDGSPEDKVAHDLAYGRLTLQQFRTLYAYGRDVGKKQAIYQKAGELNPNFNPAAFEMGFTLAKNPKVQQQLSSMDNVEKAIPDLLKFSDAASRSGVTVLNSFINRGGVALGGKKYSNLATARTAFADELSGALGFGSATDMSREMGFDMTNANLSPENFKEAIVNVVEPFIQRKRQSMLDQMGVYGQPGMNPAAGAPNAPPQASGGASTPVKVNTKAERDALPSGTVYIGPDGHQATKP